ncbi:MAG: DUF308 domain-containing protein [Actinobacteria bacterium]|nr:DUF308 domain-containing protein [Actinomycetota bacterium]
MENNASVMDEMAAQVSKMWWLWLVLGILWTAVSLIILQFSESSLTVVGVIIGIMLLVTGIQEFVMASLVEGWKWLWMMFGVFFMAGGIVALVYPKNTFAAVADMIGFLFLLVGTFWVIESFAVKPVNELWWLNLIAGILMIVLAFWAAGQFFITRAYTLLVFAGMWALAQGMVDIIRAFQVKKLGKIAVS